MRRWVTRRLHRAHQDWTMARNAWHIAQSTPMSSHADRYLAAARRRLDRWETLYRWLYIRGDR